MIPASDYDSAEKKCLPYWNVFFDTLLEFIPCDCENILELASGTGFLTEILAAEFPDLDITCLDINRDYIEFARRKENLSGVKFITGDMREFVSHIKYDAILISQALTFLNAHDRLKLAGNIYHMLNDGGTFIAGDIFSPESLFERDLYKKLWITFMVKNGFSPEEASDMVAPLDDYCQGNTVSSFEEILNSAGFSRVIVPYRREYYGIVIAYK
ncbi:class I SAM-dependent methyltransferase [Methanoplanus endosymbiosus]|uniref:Class I SAM-dependent methyltransferase n=1 Tax=Methanoplanus endosymbiosus TaxID=33865 RepID=A0A9E7TKB4_9EURY|nr:class I SAM-dependent methyltransferase [Methanoplanus endosymbiosus]UUX92475.1 class I SAM-dependent methyltransferase [Methanoplanus endosymbiosus]